MNKMYVIVRKDIPTSEQAVQGGHALAAILLDCPESREWANEILVYLVFKGEAQLYNLAFELQVHGVQHKVWREPDMNNEITAIAVYPEYNMKGNSMMGNINCL